MQALGELFEKNQPWQKHCSNLHHWHLRSYPFRYSICSGRATVAQFSIFTHIHTHFPSPLFFLFLFFFWWSCPSSVGIASVLSRLEMIVLVEAHAMIGIGRGSLRHSNSLLRVCCFRWGLRWGIHNSKFEREPYSADRGSATLKRRRHSNKMFDLRSECWNVGMRRYLQW